MYEDETQIAWTVVPRHLPVVGSDGSDLGTTESVLGDEAEDIFHGIVLRRGNGKLVEVAADRVTRMTERHVITDLTETEAESLPPYSRG
ncbi:MAG TPA: hypothetical protein VGX27_13335 [Candidatus Dormibacteraeota bacterium]|nr:hypothetical protein [Candidatus Dormibacteraeota bacterium]